MCTWFFATAIVVWACPRTGVGRCPPHCRRESTAAHRRRRQRPRRVRRATRLRRPGRGRLREESALVRQRHDEVVQVPRHPVDPAERLAEVYPGMPKGLRQRHEHLAHPPRWLRYFRNFLNAKQDAPPWKGSLLPEKRCIHPHMAHQIQEGAVEVSLADRVRERLDALGINRVEAARRAGLERSFVNDLILGKKKNILGASLLRLATALECDPAYLVGMQAEPQIPQPGEFEPPATVGACAAGLWRAPGAPPPAAALACAVMPPDPRYDLHAQRVFCVLDEHAEAAGIWRGSCVVAYRPQRSDGLHDGDLVVVRRRRPDDQSAETTIWRLGVSMEGLRVSPLGGGDAVPIDAEAEGGAVELLGIVTMIARMV